MKLFTSIKFALAAMTICFANNAAAEEINWVASEQGYENAQPVETIQFDDYVSATLALEEGGNNAPAYYDAGNALRIYALGSMTITGPNITEVAFTFGSGDGNNEILVEGQPISNGTWSGKANEVKFTVNTNASGQVKGHRRIAAISITYSNDGSVVTVKKPVITPETGTYNEPQTVTITAESGLDVFYTLNEGAEQKYSAPFTISETTTVEAYAQDVAGNKSSKAKSVITIVNLGDITGTGTVDDPYNVASAISLTNAGQVTADQVYVKGIISEIKEVSANWGNATYYISDDGKTDVQLQVFRGKFLGGEAFTDEGQIAVGDNVTVYGKLKLYNGDPEFDANNVIYMLNGKTAEDQPQPQVPEYKTIAEAKAAITATKTKSKLIFDNVTVSFAKGSNTYITDGKEGFLLYGSSVGLATGQNVNITVTGDLYLYNGLPEISVSEIQTTVNSEGNVVNPLDVEIAELVDDPIKFSNMLVKMEGVSFLEETFTSRNVGITQDGEEAVLRDNWSVATNMTFDTSAEYNITGLVAIYNDAVQIYPRAEEDIEIDSDLQKPTSAWSLDEVTVESLDAKIDAKFTTNSDGAITYSSSNENVATVSADGIITLVGGGKCVITAHTAETATFLASSASITIIVAVMDGDGSKEKPYSYNDVMTLYNDAQASEPVWVEGFIVGSANGSLAKAAFTADDENIVASNFLLAATADVNDVNNCIPVALPAGSDARKAINLLDNPGNLGKQVKIYGTIEKYFSVAGVKNVSDYVLDGQEPGPVELPEYTSIAEAKQAATADKVEVLFNVNDITVAFASGSSNYVTDGKEGFLLYGANLGLTTGQKVNVKAKGNLYLYNGLPELAVSEITPEVLSAENVVNPTVLKAEEVAANPIQYSNLLVKFEGVNFAAEALDNRNVVFTQNGTELTLRDNFKVVADMTFDTNAQYNITGFVAIYNDIVQVYPRTADDVEIVTDLEKPASAWSVASVVIPFGQPKTTNASFTTNSDATVEYSSSNESVATVNNSGVITIIGEGYAEITAHTAETAKFLASNAVLPIEVFHGDGTMEHPYNVADAIMVYNEGQAPTEVYVEAVIVGYVTGTSLNSGATFQKGEPLEEGQFYTNVLIADNESETDVNNCIPVQLPAGAIRENTQVSDDAIYAQTALFYGDITKYFGVAGIKNTTDVIINGVSVEITNLTKDNLNNEAIYNLAGQKVNNISQRGIYIINAKKVLVK